MITRKSKAFLLVEVLLTVVIASTAIIFINHAFTTSLKATATANDYLCAIFLLEDKSFDIEFKPHGDVEEGEVLSEEEFMGKKISYNQEVLPVEKEELGDEHEAEDLHLKRLILSAGWKAQDAARAIHCQTYIMTQPAQGEVEEEAQSQATENTGQAARASGGISQ
jgi:hypothetical protein